MTDIFSFVPLYLYTLQINFQIEIERLVILCVCVCVCVSVLKTFKISQYNSFTQSKFLWR